MVELLSQSVMIKVLTNQYDLILGIAFPFVVVQRKALPAEMENVSLRAFIKPENAFGAENILRQLIIEKVLKLANGEGAIAFERNRGEPIHR